MAASVGANTEEPIPTGVGRNWHLCPHQPIGASDKTRAGQARGAGKLMAGVGVSTNWPSSHTDDGLTVSSAWGPSTNTHVHTGLQQSRPPALGVKRWMWLVGGMLRDGMPVKTRW